jgi:Fic family protein
VLIPLFLYEKGLLPRPMFYLSEYIEIHRDEYIDRLHALSTRKGWNDWCSFFLKAVTHQALTNAQKADDIFNLYEELKHRAIAVTRSQYAVPMLDAIFHRPVFTAGQLELAGEMPSRVTVTNLLSSLVRDEFLQLVRPGSGRSGSIYKLSRLLKIAER